MRSISFLALLLAATLAGLAQTAATDAPGLPKDPRAIFAAAAPFYDFTSPELKPWHLKATYQLYDEKGNPGEQGTFEYWWASPTVYRSTWTRPGATHTEWHFADGNHTNQDIGEPLSFFEYKLRSAFLSPLPTADDLNPGYSRLDQEFIKSKGTKFPCIMVVPLMPHYGQLKIVPLGLFPTYCFDTQLPVLLASHDYGTMNIDFNHIVKVANRYLPREILIFEEKRKIISANVETITNLNPTDPALTLTDSNSSNSASTSSVSAQSTNQINIVHLAGGIMVGKLLKKQVPYYPQEAKDAHISGTVVLQAVIGRDGGVHDLHVISAPAPSLAISALWAVSQWQYRPYLLNGEPTEVETTVNVVFSLGG